MKSVNASETPTVQSVSFLSLTTKMSQSPELPELVNENDQQITNFNELELDEEVKIVLLCKLIE